MVKTELICFENNFLNQNKIINGFVMFSNVKELLSNDGENKTFSHFNMQNFEKGHYFPVNF